MLVVRDNSQTCGVLNQRQGACRYCPIYTFTCDVNGVKGCDMVLTSVLGHVMNLDFAEKTRCVLKCRWAR